MYVSLWVAGCYLPLYYQERQNARKHEKGGGLSSL